MDGATWLGALADLASSDPLLLLLAAAAVPVIAVFVAIPALRRESAARRAGMRRAEAPAVEPPASSAQEVARVGPAAAPGVAPAPAPRPAPQEVAEVAPPAPAEVAPVAPPAPAEVAPAPPPARLRDRLRATQEALVGRLASLVGSRRVDAELLDELEMLLMSADLGVRTADELLGKIRREAAGGDIEAVRAVLRDAILEKLRRVEPRGGDELAARPHVVLVLGVNGSGKTTTIGKLAARHAAAGRSVVLGAGDTFRAAAIEQLQVWGERVGCEVIAGPAGGDPAAVAFDTVKAAVAREADVAIIDTAGRLQTKRPLMEELSKVVRVIGRELEGAPHETLLVLDANTGQNALSQAKLFSEAARITGLVLTKLDGTAKGGVIVGLADGFGIPVKYIGVGEGVGDLRDFVADDFVDALFGSGSRA